jgi:hypothetical protein
MAGEPKNNNPEIHTDGIAPEKAGDPAFGVWQPGDVDPNQARVREISEPGQPGVVRSDVVMDFGGIAVTRERAIELGIIPDPTRQANADTSSRHDHGSSDDVR